MQVENDAVVATPGQSGGEAGNGDKADTEKVAASTLTVRESKGTMATSPRHRPYIPWYPKFK
jgi:hypothetical protein